MIAARFTHQLTAFRAASSKPKPLPNVHSVLRISVRWCTNPSQGNQKSGNPTTMFVYRPPKSMCWGHSLRPKDADWQVAKARLETFLHIYFEQVEDRNVGSSVWRWKLSVLPHVAWPADFLKPENQKWQNIDFGFTGDRVSFPFGLRFPLSIHEPSSYEFLKRFGASAPFKMSPKHFAVVVAVGKHGKFADRKPDAEVAKQLNTVFLH